MTLEKISPSVTILLDQDMETKNDIILPVQYFIMRLLTYEQKKTAAMVEESCGQSFPLPTQNKLLRKEGSV